MCSRWRGEHQSSKGNPKKFPIPLLLNFKNASLLIHLSLNSGIMHKSVSPEHGVLNSREIENPDGRKWKLSQKISQLISPKNCGSQLYLQQTHGCRVCSGHGLFVCNFSVYLKIMYFILTQLLKFNSTTTIE